MVRQTRRAHGTPWVPARGDAVPASRLSGGVVVDVWRVLEGVQDPEIPVLSIVDLGIVRHVEWRDDGRLHVGITPTYSGCPATEVIRGSVERALSHGGFAGAVVDTVL